MREYEPKYPLQILDSFLYPDLLKDSDCTVMTRNITWLALSGIQDVKRALEKTDSEVQEICENAELAYHNVSGNSWIFLVLKGNPSKISLRRMQLLYKKLYRKMGAQIQ